MISRRAVAPAVVILALSLTSACGSQDEPTSREDSTGAPTGSAQSASTSPSPSSSPAATPGTPMAVPAVSLTLPEDDGLRWTVTGTPTLLQASGETTLADGSPAYVDVSLRQSKLQPGTTFRQYAAINADATYGTIKLRPARDRVVDGRLIFVVTGSEADESATEAGTVVDSGTGLVVNIKVASLGIPAAEYTSVVDSILESIEWAE